MGKIGEFQSFAEFIKAIKKASEGQIASRLIPNNQQFEGFTEDELQQLESWAEALRSKDDYNNGQTNGKDRFGQYSVPL